MYQAPTYIWALALSASVGIPAGIAVIAHLGDREATGGRALGLKVAAVALLWIVASSLLSRLGAYGQGARHAGPWFALAFGLALGGALVGSRVRSLRSVLDKPRSLARLALPHSLRVEGVVFLILWAQGHLPAVFALPAGLGDMAVGITAPFVARRLAQGDVAGAVRFNVLGIIDLVVALGIAFLAGLGPVRVFHGLSTLPLSQLPLALIPTVAVPAAIALHVVSLVALRHWVQSHGQQPTTAALAAPAAA